ncbi:hypothetical protein R50073_05680 [Maricurvus nonylphenolicus]|uniref:hypothetical protein n=1 Tax=Maricurvus nonylphenolicus TaxID=1008307 RepID=UPI0036F259E2
MNADKHLLSLLANLKLPTQELSTLSFCQSSKADRVRRWAEELPATRITQTSAMLYQALPEVTRLKTPADNRLAMLESLRPYVQQCIQGLAKSFLNQPLILPEGAMKTAVVAQALQKHMSNGYMLAAKEYLLKPEKFRKTHTEQISLSLHRALTGMGLQLLRSYQLYTQAPIQLWAESHTLYRVAEEENLLKHPVNDELLEQAKANTIEQVYMRMLLLSCANSNQLNQTDVGILYRALEEWSKHVHLSQEPDNNIFAVNLSGNMPPNYSKRFNTDGQVELRTLDLDSLNYELNQLAKGQASHKIKRPPLMNEALFKHCLKVWGQIHERDNARRPATGGMDVIVGLSALHFYTCEEQEFHAFLHHPKQRSKAVKKSPDFNAAKLATEHDPWAQAFVSDVEPPGKAPHMADEEAREMYPIHKVERIDASPGGYCLQWHEAIPSQVRSGELLGLREPNRKHWNIGVIRWVKQNRGGTLLGIQLLAPNAEAYAIQLINKSGENGEFMRALFLPANKALKQQASLLAPSVPFQAQNKVRLNHHGITDTAHLTECIFSTSAMSQFYFRQLENTSGEGQAQQQQADDFNSDW